MSVIRVQNLAKKYPVHRGPWKKAHEWLIGTGNRGKGEFWALRDLSFEVEPGQTLGIIGQNGSGKSTLLQILAGIMRQTHGDCHVRGKVSALLELGSGFNPEFTGRENVFMNGAILGLETREIERRFESIARFAEIGEFMNQPVKTYSSGMFMRLAFAVAVHVDPDILLVDEALAVGDLIFQHRCLHRMNQLRESGRTILFVTHDLAAIAKFCDRAILLDGGCLIEDGKPDLVTQRYRALVFDRERSNPDETVPVPPIDESSALEVADTIPIVRSIPNVDHRFGNGDATLLGIELIDARGSATLEAFGGEWVAVRISVQFARDLDRPIVGFTLTDRLGIEIAAGNTQYFGNPLPGAQKGQVATTDFTFQLPHLSPGSYSLSPAVANGNLVKHDMCDWIDNALVFELKSKEQVYGTLKIEARVRNYMRRPSLVTNPPSTASARGTDSGKRSG